MKTPTALLPLALLALPSCTMPKLLSGLERESPPPAHGRPAVVRGFAQVGATLGAVIGGAATVVFLPVTWPLAQLSDEPLGYSKEEFVFFPVSIGAGGGHFLFGAPADLFDYSFRRAWMESPRPTDYEFVPEPPPRHGALEAAARGGDGPAAAPATADVPDADEAQER